MSGRGNCYIRRDTEKERVVTIACCIRYVIDPFQRDEFEVYAKEWSRIIPRCGGRLIGYFLPHEGTNNVALALIAFATLADYERYRGLLKKDEEAIANFAFAREKRFVLSEERSFLAVVEPSDARG